MPVAFYNFTQSTYINGKIRTPYTKEDIAVDKTVCDVISTRSLRSLKEGEEKFTNIDCESFNQPIVCLMKCITCTHDEIEIPKEIGVAREIFLYEPVRDIVISLLLNKEIIEDIYHKFPRTTLKSEVSSYLFKKYIQKYTIGE